MLDVFVARQPIFDREDRLVAYELLYRGGPSHTTARGISATQMSTDTIAQTLFGMGLDRVTGGKRAFVNIDREVLLDERFTPLDPEAVVLELLETVACDAETRPACEELVRRGYTLALDDFVYSPSYDPLLRLARIVKVDVLDRPVEELAEVMERLRPFDVRCLAERVENAEVHATCAALGFELFQGYFYARPEVLSGQEVPVAQANILRLLNLLRDTDASDTDVEEAFRTDLTLTYQLLRIVNSASVGGSGVDSIRHAVRLVGRSALHRWLALLFVSSFATARGTEGELVTLAIQRARLCELVGEALGRRDGGALFMAGLFSLLDALMRRPMPEILARLDLAPDLRQALLERRGPLAPTLRMVEAYEEARWDDFLAGARELGLPAEQVPELYARAAVWARDRAAAHA